MAAIKNYELQLRDLLPSDLHSEIPYLAQLLAGIAEGTISRETASHSFASSSKLSDSLEYLSGQRVTTDNATLSFGSGSQLGDISVQDIAGNNITKITVNVFLSEQQKDQNLRAISGLLFSEREPSITNEKLKHTIPSFTLSFFVYWLVANSVGWSIGRVLGWLAGSTIYSYSEKVLSLGDGIYLHPIGLALALDTIIIGTIISVVQFSITQRLFPLKQWWILTSLLVWAVVGSIGRIIGDFLGGAIIGMSLGVVQWIWLRQSVRKAWVWIIGSTIGYGLVVFANGIVNATLFNTLGGQWQAVIYQRGIGWLIAMTLASALIGVILGVSLCPFLWFLSKNKRS